MAIDITSPEERKNNVAIGKSIIRAGKKFAKSSALKNKKKEVAKKMDAGISNIYDEMEKRHKKKMEEINSSDRPEWEKKHMRRANSSGIARFLMND